MGDTPLQIILQHSIGSLPESYEGKPRRRRRHEETMSHSVNQTSSKSPVAVSKDQILYHDENVPEEIVEDIQAEVSKQVE
jgi:hypothetical protein